MQTMKTLTDSDLEAMRCLATARGSSTSMTLTKDTVLVLVEAYAAHAAHAAHAAIVDDFNRSVASIVKQQPYETADLYDHPSQALKAMCDLIEDLQARALKPAPPPPPAPPLIPVYTPLPAPEETTWGASGGDEAVCCEHIECVDGSGGVLDYSLGSDVWRDRAISVYDGGEILIHEPPDVRGLSFAYSPCADVASAIRFVVQP